MTSDQNSYREDVPSKPELIYKYESCSLRSIRNLKNGSIYFNSPLNFNDPFDCALDPRIRIPEQSDMEELRRSFLAAPDTPENVKMQIRGIDSADLGELVGDLLVARSQEAIENNVRHFLKENGVACFSEVNDELLMWSHYADSYKGFCLAFSTEFDPFRKIRKVDYSDSMPAFNVVQAMIKDDFDQMMRMFLTKSLSWRYEREWRCFHKQAGTEYRYEREALRGIYFGPNMPDDCLEIICLVLRSQNPGVSLWRGERSRDRFKLDFTKI